MPKVRVLFALLSLLVVSSAASAATLDIKYRVTGEAETVIGGFDITGMMTFRYTAIDANTIATGTNALALRTANLMLSHTAATTAFAVNLVNTLPGFHLATGSSLIGVLAGPAQFTIPGGSATVGILGFMSQPLSGIATGPATHTAFWAAFTGTNVGAGFPNDLPDFANSEKLAFAITLGEEVDRDFNNAIPEPGSFALFGVGAVLVGASLRRRQR